MLFGHPILFTALEQPTNFFFTNIIIYHYYAYSDLTLMAGPETVIISNEAQKGLISCPR